MNTTKNSRTTPDKKNAGRPTNRKIKENLYLRKDFIAYLQKKNLAPASITHYLRDIGLFLAWTETCPDTFGKEETAITKADVLKYLEHLKSDRDLQNITRKNTLIALNHYFTFLYKSEAIAENPCLLLKIIGTKKRTLYKTDTPEELTQLYDNYYLLFVQNFDDSHIPKNRRKQSFLVRNRSAVMLSMLIHQGATTKELQTLLLEDTDLIKATIKLRGGKKSNDRTIALHATQIGLLMHYIQNIRPQFLEYCNDSGHLFLALPEASKKRKEAQSVIKCFKSLTKQVKSIDKSLTNLKHIRASVITHWIKAEGLRRAQYLAGHRYISSTEKYLPNQIEGLMDDIAKFNPF